MATDNEQLVLSISADVRQIQRQLKGLVGQTQRDTKAIEAAFGGIDKTASGAFDGIVANSNRAGKAGEDAGKKLEKAMKGSAVQTGNLAAQLNDIGVQLAGGQSPFLIALQQGSQINQVLGQGGARAAVGALAGAFTSLVNPVSLATIAIISLGGAAVQYFTSLLSDSDKSEEALKKQGDLIRNIAKEWGDAIPALREYADELDRAAKIADLRAGAELINTNTLEETRAAIADAGIEIADLVSQLQGAGEETEVIAGLQEAFNDFSEAANDGSLKMEDVQRVQDALSAAINSSGIPALDAFREMFDRLSQSALGAAGSVQQMNAATGAATTALYPSQGAYAGVDRSSEGNIQNVGFTLPESGPTPDRRPTIELGTDDGSRAMSQANKSRAKAISEAERERKAVADLIDQLEFEQSTIGMTDAQRAEANALRRAGAAATEEQKARISELVEATYAERDAIKASKEAMDELNSLARDALEGIVSDLRDGKSAADIFANALGRIADKLLSGAFDNLFGGSGGGLLSGLLGGGFKGTSYFPPAPRALGGPVTAGQPYIVGEKRPELFVPNVSGTIIPKVPTGGGATVTYAPTIDARGADEAAVSRLERVIAEDKRNFTKNVIGAVQEAQKRNFRI